MLEKNAASGSKQQGVKGAGERQKSGLQAEMLVRICRFLLYQNDSCMFELNFQG